MHNGFWAADLSALFEDMFGNCGRIDTVIMMNAVRLFALAPKDRATNVIGARLCKMTDDVIPFFDPSKGHGN